MTKLVERTELKLAAIIVAFILFFAAMTFAAIDAAVAQSASVELSEPRLTRPEFPDSTLIRFTQTSHHETHRYSDMKSCACSGYSLS